MIVHRPAAFRAGRRMHDQLTILHPVAVEPGGGCLTIAFNPAGDHRPDRDIWQIEWLGLVDMQEKLRVFGHLRAAIPVFAQDTVHIKQGRPQVGVAIPVPAKHPRHGYLTVKVVDLTGGTGPIDHTVVDLQRGLRGQ